VSQWLLPATAAPTARPIYVSRDRKDAGPVQAFNSCRLYYCNSCNSLFYCIAESLMSRLQSVRNAAAVWCRALDVTTTSRPRVWNSLPAFIRDPSLSLTVLTNRLKNYLFRQ